VVGLDNLNDYYDPALKRARLDILRGEPGFAFEQIDLADRTAMERLFAGHRFTKVVHLAAQAGVRYSIDHPHAYVDANLAGFVNVLEGCRHHGCGHLVYASSSSVYGANTKMPFAESDRTDHPLTLYAATKKATEAMAHCYAHLWDLPTTVVRFFSAYGPWGRPDMALFKFTKAILEGSPIDVYNHGEMDRDFTYVDDIARSIVLLVDAVPIKPVLPEMTDEDAGLSPAAPYRVVNIGNGQPVRLLTFIEAIENSVGKPAQRNYLPMQPGDVPATYADTALLERLTGFRPSTPVSRGVAEFVAWYRDYYRI
jgi:UDP-glucuronate 4-epimerase